jgi:hypothetical protein
MNAARPTDEWNTHRTSLGWQLAAVAAEPR